MSTLWCWLRTVIIFSVICTEQLQADLETDLFGSSATASQTVRRTEFVAENISYSKAKNPFCGLRPADIARVVIAPERRIPGPEQEKEKEPAEVVITNRAAIANMVGALSRMTVTNNIPYPGIGTLGHQWFFDTTGAVFAVTTIVNYRATVLVRRSPEEPYAFCAGGRSEEFSRVVYDLMKVSFPRRIQELDMIYRRSPFRSLENLLFESKE